MFVFCCGNSKQVLPDDMRGLKGLYQKIKTNMLSDIKPTDMVHTHTFFEHVKIWHCGVFFFLRSFKCCFCLSSWVILYMPRTHSGRQTDTQKRIQTHTLTQTAHSGTANIFISLLWFLCVVILPAGYGCCLPPLYSLLPSAWIFPSLCFLLMSHSLLLTWKKDGLI